MVNRKSNGLWKCLRHCSGSTMSRTRRIIISLLIRLNRGHHSSRRGMFWHIMQHLVPTTKRNMTRLRKRKRNMLNSTASSVKDFIVMERWTALWRKTVVFLGQKIEIINAKLTQIKVPYEITRVIDSFNVFSDWKSSMYRNFFLYLFPVLEDVLPRLFPPFVQFIL